MKSKEKQKSLSRRRFLEKSAIGVAGASVVSGAMLSPRPAHALSYVDKDQINPNIDNTRVVYVHDTNMTDGVVYSQWSEQNAATSDAVVAANIDKLACALAQDANSGDAWRTIFQKPDGKDWNETIVAIKTNCIGVQHTRDAVMTKICSVLINDLGVLGTNINVYDGEDGNRMEGHWCFSNMSVNDRRKWGGVGGLAVSALPEPDGGSTTCVESIGDGTVDILINIAMSKDHGNWNGNFTMTMKNHYGTFTPNSGSGHNNYMDYLVSINKSPVILGDMDAGTSRIIFPRQQLCLIDALWASGNPNNGPGASPDKCPNRLFMGTFAPVLDYLVAKRFRNGVYGWTVRSAANRFLSDFGYTEADIVNSAQMIDAEAWKPTRLQIDQKIKRHKEGGTTDDGVEDNIDRHMEV